MATRTHAVRTNNPNTETDTFEALRDFVILRDPKISIDEVKKLQRALNKQNKTDYISKKRHGFISGSFPVETVISPLEAGTDYDIDLMRKSLSEVQYSLATVYTTTWKELHDSFREEDLIRSLVRDCKDHVNQLMKSWNHEGEDEALDYEDKTVDQAGQFLRDLVMSRNNIASDILDVDMSPASRNSIDLWWDHEKFELLINFRPDESGSYHGDDREGATIADPKRIPRIKSIGCWMEDLLCL